MDPRPTFKLYHYPATRSARVKWLLHELLGDAFEVERVPLYQGAQYGADYLAKNPNHNVPTLEIAFPDGTVMHMIESAAMIAYLADAFPEKGLAPAPGQLSRDRADYLQVLHFGSTWMDMMLWQIRCHQHLLADDEKDPRTIARYRQKFETEVEPQLLARLEKTPYICGQAFTAADCVIGHDVMWGRGYGLCRQAGFGPYLARLTERPAFMQAFSDMGDFSVAPPEGVRTAGLFTG